MIKAQYLGGEKKKKKVLKGAEKFKFNFDWEAGDDTSRDLNPLYNSTHGAPLLQTPALPPAVNKPAVAMRPGHYGQMAKACVPAAAEVRTLTARAFSNVMLHFRNH